jgi:ADP-ribosylglycohydrolase
MDAKTMKRELTIKERVLGGLWGAVVGDALGVPVEFRGRLELQSNPVTDLRGHGTHNQPKGTWSDDSSLMLCTVDSLLAHSFDPEDMAQRFVLWSRGNLWTPWDSVFDIGIATRQALSRIQQGVPAEQAGGTSENSNGNGSLMRILPIGLRFADESPERLLDYAHRASAITHRHPRSQMACGLCCLIVANLLRGQSPAKAHVNAAQTFCAIYTKTPFAVEMPHFEAVLSENLTVVKEQEIPSSGYVVDTLTASLWCLLTSKDYKQTVLKAVNLGEDTDTTGIVAGGLAGVCHGLGTVPETWRKTMARSEELETVFKRFAARLFKVQPRA